MVVGFGRRLPHDTTDSGGEPGTGLAASSGVGTLSRYHV